jgi:hypothetical protein
MALPDPETRRVVLTVLRWQRLRETHLPDHLPRVPTDADADHSALLERLLSGSEPFANPPPTAYSYPWYSLIEDGWAVVGCATWKDQPQEYERYPDTLHFRQSSWQIVARYQANGHPAWRVSHTNGWQATVEWEEGPFNVGRTIIPEPHDILEPAYIVRLTTLPTSSDRSASTSAPT